MSGKTINAAFSVDYAYPVVFDRDIFNPDQTVLRDQFSRVPDRAPHNVLMVLDNGLANAAPAFPDRITDYFAAHADVMNLVAPPLLVPGGEASKNDFAQVMAWAECMLHHHLCRHSFVCIIGGGAVLDAVGFAATLVHRGLRVLRMPSTTLAQNDAGIGVKNGINLHGGKNTLGTFHPPFAVINDLDLLNTLPDTHWIGGVSEAFKVALIKDPDFFDACCRDASAYRRRDIEPMERLIRRCAALHLEHIQTSGDPFEYGTARPLDFGHWAAHKIESLTHYAVSHGEAVAWGLLIDADYAVTQGWLDQDVAAKLEQALRETGFPLDAPHPALTGPDHPDQLLAGLDDFQEHLGGQLCVTYPDGLGRKKEVHEIDRTVMRNVIAARLTTATT